jgi:outer membrane protein OmpA-like peptidoglycan-associated protein
MKSLKTLVLTGSILGLTTQAFADINVQLFNPSMNSSFTMAEDALLYSNAQAIQFGATYNYLNRPLVELSNDRKQRVGNIVDGLNTLSLTGGYYFDDAFFAGAELPVNMVSMPGKAQSFAMGDSRLLGKVRLTPAYSTVSVALIPELYLPTGDRSLYLSDGSIGGGLKVAVEREFGRVHTTANLGYRRSTGGIYRELNYKSRLSASLGGSIRLSHLWAVNVEGTGSMLLPRSEEQNPGEAYAGLRYQPRDGMTLSLGGAVGALNGVGSADYRIIAGLQFVARPPVVETPIISAAPAPAPVIAVSAVAKTAPRVFFEPKQIRITEEVKFLHNSDLLADSAMTLLNEVAEVMKQNTANFKTITIEGHTNELGSAKHNNKLSEERAASVKEYLVSRGVSPDRLVAVGYGKSRPKKFPGLSKKAALAANRRVEFKVTAPDKVSSIGE